MSIPNVRRNVRRSAAAFAAVLVAASTAGAQGCPSCVGYSGRPSFAQGGFGRMGGGYAYAQPSAGAYYAQAPAGYYYAQPPTGYVYAQPTQPAQPAAATSPVAGDGIQQAGYVAPATATTPTATPTVATTAPAADPYGFTYWLNGVRAQYGLSAVGYDPNLESWAAMNNAQQNARGLGHFVMGAARRQNSAMGPYGSIGSMWLASPAHASALLDPTITRIGLSGSGSYWTFNAY